MFYKFPLAQLIAYDKLLTVPSSFLCWIVISEIYDLAADISSNFFSMLFLALATKAELSTIL
jgi:hypothetical protein